MDDAVAVSKDEPREWPGMTRRERVVRIVIALLIATTSVLLADYVHGVAYTALHFPLIAASVAVLAPAVKRHKPRELEPGPWSVAVTAVGWSWFRGRLAQIHAPLVARGACGDDR